jgi:hypothetical protein
MTENLWTGTRAGDPGRDPELRAADQDRDAVAEHLRTQHAEGRLDTEEFQERIDRCYQARTLGELEHLLVDLPRASSADRGARPYPQWGRPLLWLAPVIVTLAAISAVTGTHVIWLGIPLAFLATRLTGTRLSQAPGWSPRPGAGPCFSPQPAPKD